MTSCQTALKGIEAIAPNNVSCNNENQMEFIGFQNIHKSDMLCKDFGAELERQGLALNNQRTYVGDFSLDNLIHYPTSARYISYIEVSKQRYIKNDSYQDKFFRKFWGWYIAGCTLFTLFPVYIPLLCTADVNKCEITFDGEYYLHIFDKKLNEIVYSKPITVYEEKIYKGEYLHRKTDQNKVDNRYQRLLYNALLDGYADACEMLDSSYSMASPKKEEARIIQYHTFRINTQPKNAKIEVKTPRGTIERWDIIDGVVEMTLEKGEYHYTISAENYYPHEGVLLIPTASNDTTFSLNPKVGWLSIVGDSTDLTDARMELLHKVEPGRGKKMSNKEIKQNTSIHSLPLENVACDTGTYQLKIAKKKFFDYNRTISINEGDNIILSPKMRPHMTNTFIVAEAGVALNPSWGVGLMVGQVYGEVTNGCGIGWYIQGRSNFKTTKVVDGLMIDKGGTIRGVKPYYTGEQRTNELIVNAGLVLNFLNKQQPNRNKRSMFGLYAGLGYGQYARSWEIEDGRWLVYGPSAAKGISFGGGLIGSVKGFTINAGINTIQAKYVEIEAGLGWTF